MTDAESVVDSRLPHGAWSCRYASLRRIQDVVVDLYSGLSYHEKKLLGFKVGSAAASSWESHVALQG